MRRLYMKDANASQLTLPKLPYEILTLILQEWFESTGFNFKNLIKVSATCRIFRTVLHENIFWKQLYPYTLKHYNPQINEYYYKKSISSEAYFKMVVNKKFNPLTSNDPDRVFISIQNNLPSINLLEQISQELKSNKAFMLDVVEIDGQALQYASPDLQDDEDIVSCALNQSYAAIGHISERIFDDHYEAFSLEKDMQPFLLLHYEYNWSDVSPQWKQDPSFIGNVLSVLGDTEIFNGTLQRNLLEQSCKYITDPDTARCLIAGTHDSQEIMPLSLFSSNMQNDPDVVLDAVKVCGDNLLAAKNFFSDEEIVSEAVSNSNFTADTEPLLKYVSKELQDNDDIAYSAVITRAGSYEFVSDRLHKDQDLLELAMSYSAMNFIFADSSLKENKDLVLSILDEHAELRSPWFLETLPKMLRSSPDILSALGT